MARTPIIDHHLHLDPEGGRGIDAVKAFARSGGTHLMIVNKPSWNRGIRPETGGDFRPVFDHTIDIVKRASAHLDGTAWPIVGVHPGLISHLVDDQGMEPKAAADVMQAGLDAAAAFVSDGDALGLKSGRPHYDVSDAVWTASNDVMRHAFELATDLDCPVQLHAEGDDDLSDITAMAADAGLPRERVVKHYASGDLEGPIPSVMCRKEWLERAAEREVPFLMETDFIDDPDRPGAVMGPQTVPRRVRWLEEEGYQEAIRTAHVDTPKLVYDVDTEATLE
ncbi:MAG: TatD-related deoxyribonuclease [Natrialbaceae archaeon]|jgi:TatD-related deoxyribonuclease